jgi:hypothetical protein
VNTDPYLGFRSHALQSMTMKITDNPWNDISLIHVQAGAVADGTIGIIIAEKEGGGGKDKEPFTNPALVAILNRGTDGNPNGLLDAGFSMVARKNVDENSDTAQHTARGYDYKVFLASVDSSLTANSFSALKELALKFCDVSIYSTRIRKNI